jgi:hypothetical protein
MNVCWMRGHSKSAWAQIDWVIMCVCVRVCEVGAEPYIGWPIPMSMSMPTHAHGFWVGMGGHRFCAFLYPCIQLQIGVKLLKCREYVNQEALWVEASDNE